MTRYATVTPEKCHDPMLNPGMGETIPSIEPRLRLPFKLEHHPRTLR